MCKFFAQQVTYYSWVCLTRTPELHADLYLVSKLNSLYGYMSLEMIRFRNHFYYCATIAASEGLNKGLETDAKPLFSGKYMHTNEAFRIFRRSLLLLYKCNLFHKKLSNSPKKPPIVVKLRCRHTYTETFLLMKSLLRTCIAA